MVLLGPAAFTIALREYKKVRHGEDKDVTKVKPNLDGTLTYDHEGEHEKVDPKHYAQQKGVLILPNSPKITVQELKRLDVDLQRASQRVYLGASTGEDHRDLQEEHVLKDDNKCTTTKRGSQIIKKWKGDRRSERYHREKKFYAMLAGTDITPALISYNDTDFVLVLEDAGRELNDENIPKDYNQQSVHIMNLLEDRNIAHNDLWRGNILVQNGKIKIIDFEHATQLGEVPNNPTPNNNLLDITVVFRK